MTLRALLALPDHVWSVGTPAAVMGFLPSGTVRGNVACSGPAMLRLEPDARPLAFETISSDPFGWNHGIALLIPAPPRHEPTGAITDTTDDRAILKADRGRPVRDMGMGDGLVRVLLRPEADGTETWIIDTPAARIEHRQPPGPAPCHVLGGPDPGTTPLPAGWAAGAHVFPPHPMRNGFDPARHAAFQALLARHGRADLWALKQRVLRLLAEDRFEALSADRAGRMVIRVTLRQWLCQTGRLPPEPWLRRHDGALLRAAFAN